MKIIELFRKLFDPDRPPREVLAIMKKLRGYAFPRGEEQIAEEAEMLCVVLDQRILLEDLKKIVAVTKPMFLRENINHKGVIEKIPDFIFQKRSTREITSEDIQVIQSFYANYFNFYSESAIITTTKELPVNLASIDLFDQSGKFWGTAVFDERPKLTMTGREGAYQAALLMAVLAARDILSEETKDMFSQLVGLPQVEWSEIHYRQFAFGFANWLSDPFGDDLGSQRIKTFKDSVGGFMIDQRNYDNNDEMILLYKSCLVDVT